MKTLEIDDFDIKIINFDQFCKKIRLAAGQNSPNGEHASGGRLRRG